MRKKGPPNKEIMGNTNIAQMNIFVAEQPFAWRNNGYYTLVFQRELDAILRNPEVKGGDLRVLMYMIAHVDNRNQITVDFKEICEALTLSRSTVKRAIDTLIAMHLICARGENNKKYELTSKLLNPRLAFYGDSRKLMKTEAPLIMCPDGMTPLLPGEISIFGIDEQQP